jgi:hypothetical protein
MKLKPVYSEVSHVFRDLVSNVYIVVISSALTFFFARELLTQKLDFR